MRPVNLIPMEERRDGSAKLRSGPLAYILVVAMAALLAGVSLLVVTNNEVSSSEAEVTQLQREVHVSEAKATRLAAYTQLSAVHTQRVATVTELADSRFNWERVIRELSLIIPGDVWLTNLTGTASPSVSVNGAASIALRASVPGPALELIGCAKGQEAVASFVADLKDIDGVTRVGVQSSALGDLEAGGEGGGEGNGSECQTKDFLASFQLVVAFDNAPAATAEG